MLRVGVAAVFGGLLVAAHSATEVPDPAAARIAVIVGTQSFVSAVSQDDLRELYLRRRRLWPNGARAIPINLPADNPVRQAFSLHVLGRSTQDLAAYWNTRYFEGITPPTVLPSAAAVRAYVAVEPAAIGYVRAADVDEGCRVLLVIER